MKTFSIFHIPIFSFFSRDLYRDVGLNWRGTNFGYLLLLLVVCWIPQMFLIHTALSDLKEDEEVKAFISQVPTIKITDGEVSADVEQPYYVRAPDTNDVLAIIDTTGTITSIEDPNTLLLLTKNSVITRQSEYEQRSYDLSQIDDLTLNRDMATKFLNIIAQFAAIVIYPVAVVSSYIYRIIQALIYAAIGLLFARICNVKLSYDALLRLAVVAVTPCIIVGTVMSFTSFYLPLYFYLIAALLYLFSGVKSTQPEGPTNESILRAEDTTDD